MANPFEMVNGKYQQMSDTDTAAYIGNQTFIAEQAAIPAPPDLATQVANLTATVISLGGTLPDDQIALANHILEAQGQPAITVQPVNQIKVP